MTVPETPSPGLVAHSARNLLVLDEPGFEPFGYMAEGYHPRLFGDWPTLVNAARREPPSTAVLVRAAAGLADPPDSRLLTLLRAAPALPVVVALDLTSAPAEQVRHLLELRVSELVDLPVENSPSALLTRLRDAHARPYKRRLEAGLSRYVTANAAILVRAAAEVAVDRGLSTDLAAIFGVQERTVGTWCAREGLPPPRRLLVWLRVLLSVSLLEEPGRTWSNAARSVGYVGDGALRRAMTGLLGPRKARSATKAAMWADAMAAFNVELRRHRERLRAGASAPCSALAGG